MAPPRPTLSRSPRAACALWLGLLATTWVGCHRRDAPHGHGAGPHAPHGSSADPLRRGAAIQGAPGPFAVAGFRIGQRALKERGLPEGSLDIEIRHESPAEVQWSCIADGVQASTGASPGKLNLTMREVPREDSRTVARRKSTGATLSFRLLPTFSHRFVNLPRDRLSTAGAEVLALPDDQIFSIERPEAGPP
jgi:formylmethanofuran dehydrogenase subunit E